MFAMNDPTGPACVDGLQDSQSNSTPKANETANFETEAQGRTTLRSPISTARVITVPSRRNATAAGAPGHLGTNELLLTTLNPTQAPLRFRE